MCATNVQEIGIALKPTRSGAIVFNVAELSLDEAAQAAQDFQVVACTGSPHCRHMAEPYTEMRAYLRCS